MNQKNQAICGRSRNETHYFSPVFLSIEFSPVTDCIFKTEVFPHQCPEIMEKKLTLMVFVSHTIALQQVMGNTAGIFMKCEEIFELFDRKMDVFGSLGKVYNCPRKILFADLSLINLFFY